MSKITRAGQQNARPTIGLLTGNVSAAEVMYPTTLWNGAADAARERGANLICIAGGDLRLGPLGELEAGSSNVLYDLAWDNVDGLVISSGALNLFVSMEELRGFCERYRPLPTVSIAIALEGIPSALVDNETGLRDAIGHLIEVHGHRRIAFIRGPEGHQEADARYGAYVKALAEHGLALNPDLVVAGEFTRASGAAAMRLLLDERKLRPGVDLEAVAACTDRTALGALDGLNARGIRVPYDVAVVGFDDAEEAKVATPALTTVRQPVYKQAKRAVDMVLALLAGEDVPEQVTLPTEMVVRQSCGRHSQAVLLAAAEPGAGTEARSAGETLGEALTARREEILDAMAQAVASRAGEAASATTLEWAGQVLDGFVAAMGNESPGGLLSALDQVLRQVTAASDAPPTGSERSVVAWQGAISALRSQVLPWLGDDEPLSRAENLFQQARLFIAEASQQVQSRQQLQVERQTGALQGIGQALITTFDVEELMDVIARELPRLGIPSTYLSLYEHRPELAEGEQHVLPQEARLILAYGEDGRVELEPGGLRFPFRELLPEEMLPQGRRYSMLVEPLQFRDDQLGFVVFEEGPRDGAVYEVLQGQISGALRGVLLLQQRQRAEEALEKAYAEVEKQVAEQTAELRRETAERERLQQEVIEAQKQTLAELSTPVIPIMERIIVMPLIGSIDSMRARDITRALLAGIREHRAKVVILDITGVPLVDSGVADHLNKTIQAARLKGAQTIVTGVSDAVAETIVDLGIDWSGIRTLNDLQTGLRVALGSTGRRIVDSG